MTTLVQQSQLLSIPAAYVELFVLDCTKLGGITHYFSPNTAKTGGPLHWQGQMYLPVPIQTTGWEINSDGSQKKPQLIIGTASETLRVIVNGLGDLTGATLIRHRTFSNFLDGEPDANPAEMFAPDEYLVEQELAHDYEQCVWQMCSWLDQDLRLPRRQVTKDSGFPSVGAYRPSRY